MALFSVPSIILKINLGDEIGVTIISNLQIEDWEAGGYWRGLDTKISVLTLKPVLLIVTPPASQRRNGIRC